MEEAPMTPRRIAVTSILLCLVTTSLLASNDAAIRRMRDRAKEAIEEGNVSAENHIKPMIDMLRKSKDDDDQRRLVDVIVDFGRHDGSSPSAIKKYINQEMTPILLGARAGDQDGARRFRRLRAEPRGDPRELSEVATGGGAGGDDQAGR
jgi:hypothetical protein